MHFQMNTATFIIFIYFMTNTLICSAAMSPFIYDIFLNSYTTRLFLPYIASLFQGVALKISTLIEIECQKGIHCSCYDFGIHIKMSMDVVMQTCI